MPEDYAAYRARRQAELAADPNSSPQLTGTRASKPETPVVPHGPMKAAAEPAARPDASTGKKVLNLNTAVADEDAAAAAHKSMGRGVQKLDMDAIARADKELAGYDKKPAAEKESIDAKRISQAQSGLREKRNAPDIEAIATRKAPSPEDAAPVAKRTQGRRQTGRVDVSHQAPAEPAVRTPTQVKAEKTETPSSPVAGSSQFSGMMAAHGSHGNLVNPEGPKPKLGKDITYFGAVGGPKTPEEGKRGAPAYNTQQAYKKHIAGGGTPESYWADRDAKAAAKKPKAAKATTAEAPASPLAETATPSPKAQVATVEPKSSPAARPDAKPLVQAAAAPDKTMSDKPAVSKTPSVSESGTKTPPATAASTSGRRSAPVKPKASPDFEALPESGPGGSLFPETGHRRMGPERAPEAAPSAPARNPRQGVLFDTKGNTNPRATGTAPRPTMSRSEPMAQGNHPANVPSPVHSSPQFGGQGSAVHNHYYGNVNQGTGTQINGNVGGHVMTDNASIGGGDSGSGGGGGGRGAGSGNVNKGIITGNPSGMQKALYGAIHTSVNGHSIAGGVNHVTGGGHLGMNDSAGRPIGNPGDSYVQHHGMNAGHGKSGAGMGQHGDVQQGQFSRARASRQQTTPTS